MPQKNKNRKLQLIYTYGLPGSGKSTWALNKVKKDGNFKRINKDDLRDMIDAGKHSQNKEKMICKVRDSLIYGFLESGFNVIVDDTNFNLRHIERFNEIAKTAENMLDCEVKVIKKDFTNVPLEECIMNDEARLDTVGEKVIRDMYNRYLKPICNNQTKLIEDSPYLPDCVIVDIDGTLAHRKNRGPFDWKRVGEDDVDDRISRLVDHFDELGYEIILVSGRDSVCSDETRDWLEENGIHHDKLYMREEGDIRKDVIIKQEIYEKYIKGKYNVFLVLDDRNQTVNGWRELGLKTLQVEPGDF